MSDAEVEFDWDAENSRHLKRHRVSIAEFEQIFMTDPLYLEYQTENGEERFKILGATANGRTLVAVFALRFGKVRAITAYPASAAYRKLYWENRI